MMTDQHVAAVTDDDETQPFTSSADFSQTRTAQTYQHRGMEYFAPCPAVANAYTEIILQHLKYYHQQLQQVQHALCISIPWGESVKPGRHQSRTIDQKKRGQESFYLFDSDDEEFESKPQKGETLKGESVLDDPGTSITKDQGLDDSPRFESLRKRKVNDIESVETSKTDDEQTKHDARSRNSIKRQKIARIDSPGTIDTTRNFCNKDDNLTSTLEDNAENSLSNARVADESFESSPVQINTLTLITNEVKGAPQQKVSITVSNSDEEEEIFVKQRKKQISALRKKSNNLNLVAARYESSKSPKFKKKIGLLRQPMVESNVPSDEESVASSTSDSMINLHGDLFSTQIYCMKDEPKQVFPLSSEKPLECSNVNDHSLSRPKQVFPLSSECSNMEGHSSGSQNHSAMFLFNKKQLIKRKSRLSLRTEASGQVGHTVVDVNEKPGPVLGDGQKACERESEDEKPSTSEFKNMENDISHCTEFKKRKTCRSSQEEVEKSVPDGDSVITLDSSDGSDNDFSRHHSLFSEVVETYRQVKSTARRKKQETKQEVEMVSCPLCGQAFKQQAIEAHASGCEGIDKTETEAPTDMQQDSDDVAEDGGQQSREQSCDPDYQKDSLSAPPDPRYEYSKLENKNEDAAPIHGEMEMCYICDEEFSTDEYSQHLNACLANATRMQQEVDRHGFMKLFSNETEEQEPPRFTRSRSKHRSGERKIIQESESSERSNW